MNSIGELVEVHGLNIVTTLGGIAILMLFVLKYKYNRIKSLKIAFRFTILIETLLMSFMNYGAFQITVACTLSIFLFLELVILISQYPKERTKLLKWAFILMFIGGMIFYFYCHYKGLKLAIDGLLEDNSLVWAKNASWYYKVFYIVISSVMDVGWMFYGRGNANVFFSLPEAKSPPLVFLFWLLHIIAFLTAVSALLIRFGDNLLRWVRTKTQVSCVDLVFGINADSLAFSRNIVNIGDNILIYVDSVVSEDYKVSIQNIGGLVYSNANALNAKDSFLKEIHLDKKSKMNMRLRLYVLSHDYDKNIQYTRMMLSTLKKEGIPSEQTELVLLGVDEEKGMLFQSDKNRYGYGSVISFDEYEISARLLINKYPLCNFINFDENGQATEDIEVLIGGFGRIGHEVLRKVLANGLFEGSNLKITIFDPKHGDKTGFVQSQYPKMFAMPNVNINFEPKDIRSDKCFDFLKEHASNLKYIVICLEDRETARNIAVRIADRLNAMKCSQNVYTCDPKGVRCYSYSAHECETYLIYESDILCSGELDRYAMELHHQYTGGKNLNEEWKQCGYFHRMSSRASVDYLIPLIRKIMADTNALTPAQKENLAKSEHLRWCAFHYTFGYDVMEINEFIERLKKQQAEIQEHGKSDIKPRQDTETKKHVCLVSWDKLDDVSRAENSVTNGHRDFKKNDMDNIDTIMELIKPGERRI